MLKLPIFAKYAPWSPSKATLAAMCPLAFKYRYIDHVKSMARSSPSLIGVTVHRAQELVLLGEHDVESALKQAIEEQKASLAQLNQELAPADLEKIESFADAVVEFADRIQKFCVKNPIREVLLEQKWAIRQDFTPCHFEDAAAMIRGVVDLALVLESGHVIIIDHKTGKRRPASYYKAQLDIYSVFALSHLPDLRGVQCALHYVAHRKLEWSDPIRQPFIKNLLRPWLISYLNRRAERAETQTARPGKHCDWCDFREICTSRGQVDVEAGAGEVGEAQSCEV